MNVQFFVKIRLQIENKSLKNEVIHEFNLNKGILRFLVCLRGNKNLLLFRGFNVLWTESPEVSLRGKNG